MKGASDLRYPSQFVMDILRLVAYTISKTVWFIRYINRVNIPSNASPPFLIVANHQTYIDPVWICLPLRRRIRYMAIGAAFSWPLIGKLIRYIGAFPVSTTRSGAISAMKESLRTLRDGAVLVVFPEGARELADGELLEFKTGAVKIAVQAKVPVLPVTISGGNRIWPQKQKYPNLFRRVTVTYHPLIDLSENNPAPSDDEISELTDQIKAIIGGSHRKISSSSAAE